MIKILALSGSLRARSSNTAILRSMIGLAFHDMKISLDDQIGVLPHFNPDLDQEIVPASVKIWRDRLQEVDGVIICTPEYAHGIPGVLKNALDWLVSSGELVNKPIAVISASPSPDGGAHAHTSLIQTLTVMAAVIVEDATLRLPAVSAKLSRTGEVVDSATAQALLSLLKALVAAIEREAIALDTGL